MEKNKGFSTTLCGDLDYEGMIIDVCFDDQIIAMVNYEKGVDNIEVEILSHNEEEQRWLYSLDDFIAILGEAKKLAIKCAKEDDLRDIP